MASAGMSLSLPAAAKPASETRPAASTGGADGDWLCAWCLNRVANERDRFQYDGQDQFTFFNPEGLAFEIITFAQTPGCRPVGLPTLAHTWFPGHAWSFCECDGCRQQLGWCYAGAHNFAGLILSRIVKAQCLRN